MAQTKTFPIIDKTKHFIVKDTEKQINSFSRTAEYLTLEVSQDWRIPKEERYSNPLRFIYSPENCEPVFYNFEDTDIMVEHMQKESKRKCLE